MSRGGMLANCWAASNAPNGAEHVAWAERDSVDAVIGILSAKHGRLYAGKKWCGHFQAYAIYCDETR